MDGIEKLSTYSPTDMYKCLLENKDNLGSVQLLETLLKPHCKFKVLGFKGSYLRMMQIPYELSNFLIFMKENNVNSYLEIGVSNGGTWTTIHSYLSLINKNFTHSIGYDIKNKLRGFDEYQKIFPNIKFMEKSFCKSEEKYEIDLCFVDAGHLKKEVYKDFEKVLKDCKCKYIAFHDIILGEKPFINVKHIPFQAEVYKFWEEIKNKYQHYEIIDVNLPYTCGIGIIKI